MAIIFLKGGVILAYSRKTFDNYNKEFHLRVSENQFNHIIHRSCSLDLSPSDYIRKLIDLDRIGGLNEYKKSDKHN